MRLNLLVPSEASPPWFHSISFQPELTMPTAYSIKFPEKESIRCLTWSINLRTRQRGRVSSTCLCAFPSPSSSVPCFRF